ncbi:MAG: WecB/TagA/CpsF family glycosyltransferase [Pirellulales bacterium]|nr:WecB/TagA/CpsF family glycosyltransferase [Pirellulales bacterium]
MSRQVSLFGMQIDALRMDEVVAQLLTWVAARERCRYVVTPNVQHAVLFQEHAGLRQAYADAALIVPDGAPLMLVARWLGRPLPERVPGSDLVPALFAAAQVRQGLKVYLMGAATGVGQRAAENIQRVWPRVEVVGVCSPPLGFEQDEAYNQALVRQINDAQPDVLLVGLGAPKQELWVQHHSAGLRVPVVLCVGAAIDFLAGHKRRAPVWLRRIGLEWLFRLASEPRRLWRRYARDACRFPLLVWREWRATRRPKALTPAPRSS